MINERDRVPGVLLATLAGLAPLLVAADDLVKGVSLAGGFLVAYTVSATLALLLPARVPPIRAFALAALAAAASMTLYTSILRIVDPVLFELLGRRLFIVPFLGPVISVALAPKNEAARDRGWERLIGGLGFALAICLMGFMRELLSSGAISIDLAGQALGRPILPIASQPSGALILIGLVSAAIVAVSRAVLRPSP